MNYRHAFHAGNFADVFKHLLITRILLHLMRKETPLRYLDTHAGCGDYDLAGVAAVRTCEWRNGIARLDEGPQPAAVEPLIRPYLGLVGPRDADHRPKIYPGSPRIAQRLLREQDRLLLSELHCADVAALRVALARDPRAKIVAIDGYVALAAFVPPKERRGLVLIDPPYESRDEFRRIETALGKATGKWPTGIYAIWYPIKELGAADAFIERVALLAKGRCLRLELMRERTPKPGAHDALALIGCGMLVLNPPHRLESEAGILLPYLADRLAPAAGSWRVEASQLSPLRLARRDRTDDAMESAGDELAIEQPIGIDGPGH